MSKRIASSAVNWSSILEKLKPAERAKIIEFKSVIDKYTRDIASKPQELPKIDWSHYQSKISAPGFVDSFKKNYEALKVPYPTDQGMLSQVESKNAEFKKKTNAHVEDVMKQAEGLDKKLSEMKAMMPFSQMTVEEYWLARPEEGFDENNPKKWPFNIKDDEDEPEHKKEH